MAQCLTRGHGPVDPRLTSATVAYVAGHRASTRLPSVIQLKARWCSHEDVTAMSASQIKINVSPPLPDFFEVGWLFIICGVGLAEYGITGVPELKIN